MKKTTRKSKAAPAPTSAIPQKLTASLAKAEVPAQPKQVEAAPAKAIVEAAQSANRIRLELVSPSAKTVYVAGSFNGWKPDQTPLKPAGNGRWIGNLEVHPGRYEYLFVVDGQWTPDPNAPEAAPNPFGGTNSVLQVAE